MSPLDELQKDVQDRTIPVSTLLRKAKIFAKKIGLTEPEWMEQELNGYNEKEGRPPYRMIKGIPQAFKFGTWVPAQFSDPKSQDIISQQMIPQSVGQLEEISKSETFGITYPSTIEALLRTKFDLNTQFKLNVHKSEVVGILEAVRTRLLNWLLDIDPSKLKDVSTPDDSRQKTKDSHSPKNKLGLLERITNNSTLAIIISAIFLFALGLLLAHIVGYNPFYPNPNSTTTTLSEIQNWQTYTDTSMGVTVKFPSQWYVVSVSGLPGYFDLSNASGVAYAEGGANDADLSIQLDAFNTALPIDQWYQNYFSSTPLKNAISKSDKTIGGLAAIEVAENNNDTGIATDDYFVAEGGHVFEIVYSTAQPQYADIYQTILTNLKFFTISIPSGSYTVSNDNIFPTKIISNQIVQELYSAIPNSIQTAAGNGVDGELVLLSSSNDFAQEQKYVVSESTASQLGGETGITGVIGDPQGKDTVFISNSNYFPNNISTCTNGLYTYNVKTGNLVEFYSEVDKDNAPMNTSECRVLRVVGIQGSKLIILIDFPGDSPSPCSSFWSDPNYQFMYIELADVKNGLQPFVVPQYEVSNDKATVQQCLKNNS